MKEKEQIENLLVELRKDDIGINGTVDRCIYSSEAARVVLIIALENYLSTL